MRKRWVLMGFLLAFDKHLPMEAEEQLQQA
jgi:hypothetical protein